MSEARSARSRASSEQRPTPRPGSRPRDEIEGRVVPPALARHRRPAREDHLDAPPFVTMAARRSTLATCGRSTLVTCGRTTLARRIVLAAWPTALARCRCSTILRRSAPLGCLALRGRGARPVPLRGARRPVGLSSAVGRRTGWLGSWPPGGRPGDRRTTAQTERLTPLALIVISILNELEHRVSVRSTRAVFDEVDDLDEAAAQDVGLRVVDPELDDLLAAAQVPRGALSFQDRLCLLVAQRRGWTCVSNDKPLRQECSIRGVPVLWGLEMLALAAPSVAVAELEAARGQSIARAPGTCPRSSSRLSWRSCGRSN